MYTWPVVVSQQQKVNQKMPCLRRHAPANDASTRQCTQETTAKMNNLSPRAQKNLHEAAARDRQWMPRLARTSDKLLLFHATRNARGQRQATARRMQTLEPWKWDNQKCRFAAELSVTNLRQVLDAWTEYGYIRITLSDGVHEFMKGDAD